jgi:hypothetical protein
MCYYRLFRSVVVKVKGIVLYLSVDLTSVPLPTVFNAVYVQRMESIEGVA